MLEDSWVHVRFLIDPGWAPDRTYRERESDDRTTSIVASVRLVDDEGPEDTPDLATVEMTLIHCEGYHKPWFIFDGLDMEPLYQALFDCGDEILGTIRRRCGVKSNDVLVLEKIGDVEGLSLDQWLPNVLVRFCQTCNFRGAIVIEDDETEVPSQCGFEPLRPVRFNGLWQYYIHNYRALPRR